MLWLKNFQKILAIMLCLPIMSASARKLPGAEVQVGVFYYPGWSPNIPFARYREPWAPIEHFPERMPLVGKYDDREPQTLRRQLNDMRRGNLRFVVFDTYINAGGRLRATHAVDAYLKVANEKDPNFALMWANHDEMFVASDWESIVNQWVRHYISDSRYFRYKGKPALFIFSMAKLEERAEASGSSTSKLFLAAQRIAHIAGLPGISFIGGSGPLQPAQSLLARTAGYAAITAYGMGPGKNEPPRSTPGYAGRDQRDRVLWRRWLADAYLPVILPLDAGWDRRPWGGTNQINEDNSMSTPAQFEKHVRAGISALELRRKDEKVAVVCCWNEYGEGSVIEPTRQFGYGHLKALRTVQSR